jgi:hypothetical protein
MTSCEMPICEYPFGRDHFEPRADDDLGDWSLTDDHIVPKADGGSNARDNLRPAHRLCNPSPTRARSVGRIDATSKESKKRGSASSLRRPDSDMRLPWWKD